MTIALTSIVRCLDIGPTHKTILEQICTFANDDFYAWPSVDLLALVTGFSDRCVQKYIKIDRENGVLEEVTGEIAKTKSTLYFVHPDRMFEVYGIRAGLERLLPGLKAPKKGERRSPQQQEKGERRSPKGESNDVEGRTRFTQIVSNNQEPCAAASADADRDADGAKPDTLTLRWYDLKPWVDQRWGEGHWISWWAQLLVFSWDDDGLILEAPSRFIADEFRKTYRPYLKDKVGIEVEITHTGRAHERWKNQGPAIKAKFREGAG